MRLWLVVMHTWLVVFQNGCTEQRAVRQKVSSAPDLTEAVMLHDMVTSFLRQVNPRCSFIPCQSRNATSSFDPRYYSLVK